MKPVLCLALAALFAAAPVHSQPVAAPGGERVVVADPTPAQGPLARLLAEHAARAAAMNRPAFVELTREGCAPCDAIRNTLGDPQMAAAFRGIYLIRLDIMQWREQLAEAGLDGSRVPRFYAIDTAGRPQGEPISGSAWGANTPENMAPPLSEFFARSRPRQ